MFTLSTNDFMLTLAGASLIMGVITFIVGISILAFKVRSNEFNEISAHAAKLMNKGLVENMAGLVENTTSLLQSINQMARTKSGVGFFLILVTFVLIGASFLLINSIP